MRRSISILIVFIITATSFFAACARSSDDFEKQLSQIQVQPGQPASEFGSVSYVLYDPETGKIIEEKNRRQTLIPASTTKLLTVGTALHRLGLDHRFKTTLGWTGSKTSGDLILVGGEDPELRVRNLISFINELQESGIQNWNGRFFYRDEAVFIQPSIEASMSDEAAYNPSLSSLSLDSNISFLRFKKTKDSYDTFLTPSLPGTTVSVSKEAAGSADDRDVIFQGDPARPNTAWLLKKPTTAEGVKILPVKNAGLFTAQVFQSLAKSRGITLSGPEFTSSLQPKHILAIHESRPLWQIAETIFATSDNVMTELVLLHLAKAITSKPQSLKESAAYLESSVKRSLPNIDWNGFHLDNGSGLTPNNRISAEQLLAVLLYTDQISGGIERLLPVGGWTQGLQNRFTHPNQAFRVVAKSGGIFYSTTLCGFLYSASGRRFAFAILVSDLDKRKMYDQSSDEKNTRKKVYEAQRWMKQGTEYLDSIVSGWIDKY